MKKNLRPDPVHHLPSGRTSHATSTEGKHDLPFFQGWGQRTIQWAARAACIIVALDVYFRQHNLLWFLVLIGVALGELTLTELFKHLGARHPPED